MTYKIKVEKFANDNWEKFEVFAVGGDGKRIFGAGSEVTRSKNFTSPYDWEKWVINWGSCGSMTYAEKLPYTDAIACGMQIIQALEEGRPVSDDGTM